MYRKNCELASRSFRNIKRKQKIRNKYRQSNIKIYSAAVMQKEAVINKWPIFTKLRESQGSLLCPKFNFDFDLRLSVFVCRTVFRPVCLTLFSVWPYVYACLQFCLSVCPNTRDSVLWGYPNTEKRGENTTRAEFKVFVLLMKHCLECLINLLNRNKNSRVNGK